MVDLGHLGDGYSSATHVSADGSAVAGKSKNADGNNRAFFWSEGTGMISVGTLGGSYSTISNFSQDGSTIVGDTTNGSMSVAFRWTQETGIEDVSAGLPSSSAGANDVSADGGVIVGSYEDNSENNFAFRWTEETGARNLKELLTEAGVDMTGISLETASRVSNSGAYIVGSGDFPGHSNTKYLVRYDTSSGTAGVTTGSAQSESVKEVSAAQKESMMATRSNSNALLGMTQPVMQASAMSSEATVGSAMLAQNGQFVIDDEWTLLGGIAFGSNEYENVERKNAFLIAGGVRYKMDRFIDLGDELSPYVEIGGWYSPDADMEITRPYMNGGGKALGKGHTQSSQWSSYAKLGLVWDFTDKEQLNTWVDIGQQAMSFDAYTERSTPGNPFPASMSSGTIRMGVARLGTSYTIDVEQLAAKEMGKDFPASITLSGALATSYGVSSDLKTTVAGVGAVNATPSSEQWVELGARIEMNLTENWSLSTSVSGTLSQNTTSLHGGMGVSYDF